MYGNAQNKVFGHIDDMLCFYLILWRVDKNIAKGPSCLFFFFISNQTPEKNGRWLAYALNICLTIRECDKRQHVFKINVYPAQR